jgi:hypothetical protein
MGSFRPSRYYNRYFIIVASLLIAILTLRHDYVGTDTQNYRILFNLLGTLPFETALAHISDVGFILLVKVLTILGLDFRFLLFLQALLYIVAITFIIKKYSKIPVMSYWLFMTFGFFIFATTMRQAIAISFTLLAYHLIREKRMVLFILCVLLASSFHLTALIFLPAYWIDKFKYNKFTILLILSIIASTAIFNNKIGAFILAYSKNQYATTSTGGYFQILLIVALLAVGIIYRKSYIYKNIDNKMLFFMMAATLALIPVSKLNPALFRIINYYFIFMTLYIPNLISTIRDKGMKFMLTYGFIILGLFNFYYKIGTYGIRMHPFIFFWSEYPTNLIP